jgi:hypothetical protein
VTDDGTPILSDTETMTVKLLDMPERFHRPDRLEFFGLRFTDAIAAQQAWVHRFVGEPEIEDDLVVTIRM